MKNYILLLLVAMSSLCMSAQKRGDMQYGFNLGLNMTNMKVSSLSIGAGETKYSFNAAGLLEYYFDSQWSIKGKLILDNKGWENQLYQVDGNSFGDATAHFTYVTVPLMAGFHFGNAKNFYLNYGFYSGFLVNAKIDDTNVKEYFNEVDFGLCYGAGAKFDINKNTTFFIEYQSQSGVYNIANESQASSTVKNRRHGINFGFLFDVY